MEDFVNSVPVPPTKSFYIRMFLIKGVTPEKENLTLLLYILGCGKNGFTVYMESNAMINK